MYKEPDRLFWSGREDKEKLAKRWHEKIEFLPPPFEKKRGIALLGFECDEGVKRNKGRVGAKKGNDELKKAMGSFAFHLINKPLYDAGKVIADSNLEASQKILSSYIAMLLAKKHFPIVIGGGHETAFGSFMGLFGFLETKEDIAIINFDAHFDLRDEAKATSGTPFAQISSACKSNNISFNYMCLGISEASNTQALFVKAKELNVRYILDTKMTYKNLKKIKMKIDKFLKKKRHIYISIDTDVFSSFSVPSVSAASSRGIEINITYDLLKYIFKNYGQKIKLLDFTEFNPKYDISGIGKRTISRLVYDIAGFVDRYI